MFSILKECYGLQVEENSEGECKRIWMYGYSVYE